ncbi:L,D-transpeptidase [Conexibacter woesei]|uniref:ErfK/YbiS/YcfS/YnhG family protein n=1 Tax=Conexibacter woesei (strain DSM 14684 / CCUG 47730 / CIP 108061 / JCM 11494 / NBRC 100937 / ID131577) TaxID=469383 RepID=D3F6U9_CONWI|nr:L,D-transpeptidase [Conexibacter woesei]ADB52747.1 ErfK/YbiS/YcfS/YnhG family protein [Conexibacter woesei DSM 14684]
MRARPSLRRAAGAVAVVLVAVVVGLALGGALSGGGDGDGARVQGGDLAALAHAAPAAGGSTDFSPGAARSDPARGVAIVARGRSSSVAVYARPGGPQLRRVQRRTVDGARLPVVFSVLERRGGWLKVELPVRPNKGRGWVRARDVRLARTPYRIEIRLRDHRLVVFAHDRPALRAPIAVGRAVSPTPTGRYFVADLLRPPNPTGFYGPYALGLSAYSPVYTRFAGGDGQVGIHGTNTPRVLGSDVSHGCIRVSNATVTRLATLVPLGTPVRIRT